MDVLNEARQRIEAGLAEIDHEIERLQEVIRNLDGRVSAIGRRSGRRSAAPKASRTGAGRRQARKGQRREEVLAAIQANPGIKASEIAEQIGISANQVSGIGKALVKEKAVKKRGPKYTAVA
jgi:predicted HTH transcriptional regulator